MPYWNRILVCLFAALGVVYEESPALHMGFLKTSVVPDRSIKISWDTTTRQRLSAAGSAAFYPRMIRLKDGALLAAYASNGNIAIIKSYDSGRHWTVPAIAAAQQGDINRDTPELLQLQNSDVLLCYASRPQAAMKGAPDSSQHFDIRIKKSGDAGITWGFEKVLYTGGTSVKEGCWEPSAVQLPSGKIQLFFANETMYPASDEQNISMLHSADNGAEWSSVPQLVSFRNGSRDGMPVPLWLPERREVLLAIEDPGVKNFKPYIIRSSRNGVWSKIITGNDPARTYALTEKIADSVYAGAPYLRRLATGEVILSYQSTEGRKVNKDYNAVMVVAVGDQAGKNFSNKTVPFAVPEGYGALWNSMCVLNDDAVIALTSTNAFSRARSEVWMIKGYVNRE